MALEGRRPVPFILILRYDRGTTVQKLRKRGNTVAVSVFGPVQVFILSSVFVVVPVAPLRLFVCPPLSSCCVPTEDLLLLRAAPALANVPPQPRVQIASIYCNGLLLFISKNCASLKWTLDFFFHSYFRYLRLRCRLLLFYLFIYFQNKICLLSTVPVHKCLSRMLNGSDRKAARLCADKRLSVCLSVCFPSIHLAGGKQQKRE